MCSRRSRLEHVEVRFGVELVVERHLVDNLVRLIDEVEP